jgi:uncharacterized protein (DUF2267 family)
MSEQGLEVIESSTQKTYEWIARLAETAHLEKRDAYRALRAVLQTVRDRLPLNDAVHFAAQVPTFLRGLFFEGWEPSVVPIKMSREEFLHRINSDEARRAVCDPVKDLNGVRDVQFVSGGTIVTFKLPMTIGSLS